MKLLSIISSSAKMNLPDLLWPPAGLMKRDHGHKILAQISNKGRCLDIRVKQSKCFPLAIELRERGTDVILYATKRT